MYLLGEIVRRGSRVLPSRKCCLREVKFTQTSKTAMGQEHAEDFEVVGSQVRSLVTQLLYGKNKILE